MNSNTAIDNIEAQTNKSKFSFLIYGFSIIIGLVFVMLASLFDGVAYQLIVFFLGLSFLGIALYKNIASETTTNEIPSEKVKQKVNEFFPNLAIEKATLSKESDGATSVLIQIDRKNRGCKTLNSSVIKKFIKNHFGVKNVEIELI